MVWPATPWAEIERTIGEKGAHGSNAISVCDGYSNVFRVRDRRYPTLAWCRHGSWEIVEREA